MDRLPNTQAPRRKPRGWFVLLLGNIAVFLVIVGVICGAGEIYYRFFFDSTDSFALSRVSRRWFKRHWVLNNAKLRDNVNYTYELDPNKRRISFLGDSFTAGHGIADVDKRFANLIRKRNQSDWQVQILAANGLDTGRELDNLKSFVSGGSKLDVLVLVYVLNDISDIIPEWGTILDRIYSENDNETFLVKHSFLINTIYYRIKSSGDTDYEKYYDFVRQAYESNLFDLQKDRLESLYEFCKQKNIELLVVTFPFLHLMGRDDYAYRGVHRALDRFWLDLGVPHLDLLPVYEKYKARDLVIGRYDAHPNLFAHRIAADAIEAFLRKNVKPASIHAARALDETRKRVGVPEFKPE